MNKNFFYFLMMLAAATCAMPVNAQTSVATVPEGMISFFLAHGSINYLSLPLTNNANYTSSVSSVTNNTITVDDAPAPFTIQLAAPAAPYFVKFLSGNESGRVLLVTANTANCLTLDTTDHDSGSAVALTATSFNVQVGDTFEVFQGDTLASVFGGTPQNQMLLTGGANVSASDVISLYNATGTRTAVYYFNTNAGYWEQSGTKANANNTIIYPYSAFTVSRRSNHPDTMLVLAGRVTQVPAVTKLVSKGTVYTSSHYATDIKLSQLQFGSNWTTGSTVKTADTISVWNPTLGHFETFYQKPDSTWRNSTDAVTDQSNYSIAAGTVTTIAKREAVSGGASFLQTSLPYSLN